MAVIYIKAERNIEVSNPRVRLGDVLKIESRILSFWNESKKIPLMTFQNTDQKQESRAAISVLGVIKKIHGEIPDLEIQNVGEIDFIITYKKEKGCRKTYASFKNRLRGFDQLFWSSLFGDGL